MNQLLKIFHLANVEDSAGNERKARELEKEALLVAQAEDKLLYEDQARKIERAMIQSGIDLESVNKDRLMVALFGPDPESVLTPEERQKMMDLEERPYLSPALQKELDVLYNRDPETNPGMFNLGNWEEVSYEFVDDLVDRLLRKLNDSDKKIYISNVMQESVQEIANGYKVQADKYREKGNKKKADLLDEKADSLVLNAKRNILPLVGTEEYNQIKELILKNAKDRFKQDKIKEFSDELAPYLKEIPARTDVPRKKKSRQETRTLRDLVPYERTGPKHPSRGPREEMTTRTMDPIEHALSVLKTSSEIGPLFENVVSKLTSDPAKLDELYAAIEAKEIKSEVDEQALEYINKLKAEKSITPSEIEEPKENI